MPDTDPTQKDPQAEDVKPAPPAAAGPASERRTQIKLTAKPSRRALPAVIAASADEGDQGRIVATPITSSKFGDTARAEQPLLTDAVGGNVLFSLDRALRFSFANRAAEQFFGRSVDALLGRPVAVFTADAGKGDSEFVARLRDTMRDGTADSFEIQFEPGEPYHVFVTPHPEGVYVCLRDNSAQFAGVSELQEWRYLSDRLLQSVPAAAYIYDLKSGKTIFENRYAAERLGYDTHEKDSELSHTLLSTGTGDQARLLEDARRPLYAGANSVRFVLGKQRRDGAVVRFAVTEEVCKFSADGSPLLVSGIAVVDSDGPPADATVGVGARSVSDSPDCVLTLDLNGCLVAINPSGKSLMAISDFAPLIGAEWVLLFQDGSRSLAKSALNGALSGKTERFQGFAKTAVGTPVWWDVIVRPVYDPDKRLTEILTVARDMTDSRAAEQEREKALQEAIQRADFDPLTGLLNQRAFHRKLHEAAMVDGTHLASLAILLIDIENFRYFNEAYGRAIGDDLLIRVAKELTLCCRTRETLARIGPDEFGIIIPQMQSAEVGPYIMRLRAMIDGMALRSPDGMDTIPLNIAVGYALFPEDTASVSAAYDIAAERQHADRTGGHSREAERVRESLRESIDSFGMMDTLIQTIDSKDRLTRRQSEDTLIYCRRMADRFGLDDRQKHSLDIASLLHDVGKVGIDERILCQPGKLTDADFSVIQQHPKIGAMLVGSSVDDVDTVEAILYHHENWNGTGYPAGLSGAEIPLLARILNVASSYAAMTNNRPYRKGMPAAAALKVLQSGAGTQWDPECVAALLSAASE